MRAINDGDTDDFLEARLTARSCASARERLQLGGLRQGGFTDDGLILLLARYRLGRVVCWRGLRDSVLRRIWEGLFRKCSGIILLLYIDNLLPIC
jgi:hypothetical protein